MMFAEDGKALRDIDIDELKISVGRPVGKQIVLTKTKVTYQNIISAGICPDDFTEGFFTMKEISIDREQFNEISDAIYNAGLFNLVKPDVELDETYVFFPGKSSKEYMICTFDDGVTERYEVGVQTDLRFLDIARILETLFEGKEKIEIENIEGNKSCDDENTEGGKSYETSCCGAVIPEEWSYCPECGKKLEDAHKKETTKIFDKFFTSGICNNCMGSIPMIYDYCGLCGTKY